MASGKTPDVAIVGGGLVGSLLSLFLSRRGLEVAVFERRPDFRASRGEAGRSINLVVTSRGTRALEAVGLEQPVARLTVPVMGRMMHGLDGELSYQPYGKDDSECNYSISRAELNALLATEAEQRGVHFHFQHELLGADFEASTLKFAAGPARRSSEVEAPMVFGADGAASALRAEIVKLGGFEESAELLSHGYKELLIPAGERDTFRIEKNALHIWPRGSLMLMALPNRDGSFTVTLYLPNEGPLGFAEVDDADKVVGLFAEQFADAVPLIPDLSGSYLANPTGVLGTVRCRPWHVRDKALLIGDAAHAIVPFFGQGMNCGFEDCTVLDALLDEHGVGNWGRVCSEFSRCRKPDADAIADMALENFVEMRDKVSDTAFLLRKQVEHRLEQSMPQEYRSRYSMVMYSSIPYRVARDAGLVQQQILDELCEGLRHVDELDLQRARDLIGKKLTPLLERQSISLDY